MATPFLILPEWRFQDSESIIVGRSIERQGADFGRERRFSTLSAIGSAFHNSGTTANANSGLQQACNGPPYQSCRTLPTVGIVQRSDYTRLRCRFPIHTDFRNFFGPKPSNQQQKPREQSSSVSGAWFPRGSIHRQRSVLMRHSVVSLSLTVAILAVFAAAPVRSADEAKGDSRSVVALPRVTPEIQQALADRDFGKAVTLIDAALKTGKPSAPDYLLYLRGRAQTQLKQFDAGRLTFETLESDYPESLWVARSRFGRADILVRQRDYQKAGEIYRAAAQRLLSAGRRDELAGIYLDFANRYFEGVHGKSLLEKPKPDYQQALLYFSEALKMNASAQVRHTVDLRIARSHQELGQYPQSISAYRKYLADYADKQEGDARTPWNLAAEAHYQLGRALLDSGQQEEARRQWQDFLVLIENRKDANPEPESVLNLQAEATYKMAHTHGLPQPASTGDLELGVAAHERFLKQFPKHKLAAQADHEIAQSYVHLKRFDQAIAQLQQMIANDAYAQSQFLAEGRRLLGQSYFAQKKFAEAIAAWKTFLEKHASNASWSDVQRSVINAEYEMATEQLREKNYAAARTLWDTFLNKYPLDARAPRILLTFGQMKLAEAIQRQRTQLKLDDDEDVPADRNPAPGIQKLYDEAIADWKRLLSKYPGGKEASQASYQIGTTLEDRLARLEDALKAYKVVTGPSESAAKKRINRLTAKQLELTTQRKFRSNEKASVRVQTRNIESVSVSVYRIDMVDYFRKMHLATGVEALDIALIDPDKSWDYKIDEYEAHRRLTNDVEIPIDEPGILAVTVSGENLQATTMVVISDLDVIVKSSRNELFVFVENMLTQQPVPEASLLISDGSKVFAEEATGADGVLQETYDSLKNVTDLRVFAIHKGHAASTVTNLNGLNFAVGLAPKGYLYTDRPAYRSDQLVNLKGVIRWVEDDRFVFKEGETYRLDVYDSRGRVVHTDKVALGKFGTFAAHFTLPEAAQQGDYRVHVHQPATKQSYETSFLVHEHKLEPVHVTVDLPRKVYYRGETIEGTIKLQYYYGTPLAGRAIEYRLDDGRQHTAKTNAQGEVPFSFETQRFSETQPLQLSVVYPERNIGTSEMLQLATRGFSVGVSALRNVYISGETFDVTMNVSDPGGEPVGTPLTLEILEQTRVGRETGERVTETIEVASDKEQGEARKTLKIENSGRYVLRATGVDQFGNRVSGQKMIIISGDDDDIRLRVLAEKHHYSLGDTAQVQLHWRDAPALALVTYEGATILGHRLVELKTGANPLQIPLDSQLAPNFRLAVAVMEGDRFHQAGTELRVARRLKVALKPAKTELGPGDELKVEITVTDLQGKPVSAELSLGLIQKNLLDYFGGTEASIDTFFGTGYRRPSVRATTSCTFRYLPKTRPVNAALLAEAERERLEAMEVASRLSLGENVASWALRDPSGPLTGLGDNASRHLTRNSGGTQVGQLFGGGGQGQSFAWSGEAANLVTNYNELMQQRRYSEAEVLAKQVQELAPDSPQAQVMTWKSRFARRSQRNDLLGRSQEEGLWGKLAEVEQSSVPIVNGVALSREARARQQLELLNAPARKEGANFEALIDLIQNETSGPWEEIDGQGGTISEYETTLSLTIRQTQTVHSEASTQLFTDLSRINGTVTAVNGDGTFQVVNGLSVAALKTFAAPGMQILPTMRSAETGYWNPLVVTGEDGKASVSFRLPERSTAWKLQARGVDAESLSGQAEVDVVARKELFGELKAPLAFYEGDKAHVIAEIQNSVVKQGETIDVVLKATIGERSTELKKTIESKGPGVAEVTFPIEITAGDKVEFELTVTAGQRSDVAKLTTKIRPYGLPVFATAGGSAGQSTITFVEHDKKQPVQNPQLEILIGPGVDRALLDAVTGGGVSPLEAALVVPRSGLERAVSDVLGGIALLKMTGDSQTSDSPEAQTLLGKIRSSVSQLVTSQRDDGGWSWSGRPNAPKSDRYLSSRGLWALARARDAGFAVPNEALNTAVQFLRTSYTATLQSDREAQAILLHGLTEAGAGDFAPANRLYRERNSLSPSGLLHLALVLAKLDRKEMSRELLKLVDIPLDPKIANGQAEDVAVHRCIPWMQTGVELRALYLLALEEVDPQSDKLAKLAEWLLAARRGTRWVPEKVNGPAVAALSEWFTSTKVINEKYTLSVFVNDKLVEKIDVDPSTDATRRLQVPTELLAAEGPQQINFDLEGRGRFSYSAILSGFVPADRLKGTTPDWVVKRVYEPAPQTLDGKTIPRGFGVAERYTAFRNPLTQLPMGQRGEVTLDVDRRNVRRERGEQFDYLVVVEPIPAGAMVLTESIKGDFERYDTAPGAITFYVGDKPYPGEIHYTLVGYLPGEYRAAPTVARSFYRPERIAVSGLKSLQLLARGAESKDAHRLTPVELFEYGKRYHERGDHAQTAQHLTDLFENWQLKDEVYQQVVRMLFESSLVIEKDDAIVEYFEIIKERYPDVELDYTSILRVAAAYRTLGEYERSYLVFRATVEGRFQRESQIAGFLTARGEFLRSVQVVEELLRQYPAEPYVAIAAHSLAGEVYGKAAAAAADEKLRKAKITRVDLIAASIHLLDHFLATWPTDPAADQASFAMASAYLDLEQYDEVIARCGKFAQRYPQSKLFDSFWYVIGYARFALGEHKQALEMCRKVAQWTRKNPQTGAPDEAANKWEAIYIMGQVHHSLGQAGDAIREYERVKSRFADANQAIDFFTRKAIALPEVATIKPGAAAEVTLKFRNLSSANVKVYRIDLLKFGLMRRNLNQITAINLAGIRPYHTLKLDLGDGKDYRDREQTLKMPLKEEGAYLVVCRGENLYASGLVLVSPLELQIQEDAVSGRVRVTVKDNICNTVGGNINRGFQPIIGNFNT
ncbi:MAG: hypothetical protein CMJ48_01750, partial [Planctomycetaceae bacterium]|nr:hypothetical protein [Planctomycetaceae bacterium]